MTFSTNILLSLTSSVVVALVRGYVGFVVVLPELFKAFSLVVQKEWTL